MRTFILDTENPAPEIENDGWTYPIGGMVQLVLSHEKGNVVGRYHASQGEDQYELIYVNGAGCQVRGAWGESWIEPVSSDLN